ncbi:hypothetical protein [Duganella levis]|uniref:Membrane protein 6-pyruvoyl-tetrahydropterin synthase-related domain-containing protein n=1 Tax=Duganella levis TaxID=2692169 RepID=A0ABW9W545_9BURK|nr:hypothetical protein [Duganella levis]MYN29088.1 hypothetical protein [Duganella levis]
MLFFNLNQFKFRYLFIFCSAIIIIAFFPLLAFGVRSGHDLPTHLSWFLSVRDIFSSGFSYPRWLSDQMDGMGAPTFYFYPPFSTFFSVLVDLLFLGKLPPDRVIGISAFFMSVLSAAAFFVWARNYTDKKIAILVSTFYAVAPYHLLCNFYTRAAIAEYAAYIWIPLIFCGILKVLTSDKKKWVLILALSVAGIFLTHLLTAMLVGPIAFVYSLLVAFSENKVSKLDPKKIFLLVFSSAIGIGMSALYFVPALSLFDQIDSSMLFQVAIEQTALFSEFSLANFAKFEMVLSLIVIIYLSFSIYCLIECKMSSARITKASGYFAVFWLLVAALATAAMAGKMMFLFQEPSPLRKIQFLWRILSVVEFSAITLFLVVISNLQSSAARSRIVLLGVLIFASFFLLQNFSSYKFIKKEKNDRTELFGKEMVKYRLSPTEYFPAGTTLSSEPGAIAHRLGAHLETAFIGQVESGDAKIITATRSGAKFLIKVDAREKSIVSIHQFYFPGWNAVDEKNTVLPVLPVTADKLVGFEVLPGVHQISIERTTTNAEAKGNWISIISFTLFILLAVYFTVQFQKKRKIA